MQGGSDPSLEEVGGAQGQSSRGTARRGNVPWGTRGQARSLRVCGRDFICRAFVIPYPRQVGCGKIRKGSRFKKKVLTLESVEFNGGRLFGPRGWVGSKAGARSLRASGVGGGLRHLLGRPCGEFGEAGGCAGRGWSQGSYSFRMGATETGSKAPGHRPVGRVRLSTASHTPHLE